jgi:hypothetical protein
VITIEDGRIVRQETGAAMRATLLRAS